MQPTGIYIHIPFCKRECYYCHFTKTKYHAETLHRYTKALINEIGLSSTGKKQNADSIYIGGGSPSLLEEARLTEITAALYERFTILENTEFTIEANPEDLNKERLDTFKKIGINRLSIGTQSFTPADLTLLRRTHSAARSLSAVRAALEAGFTNINIDFIIGLPSQTKTTLMQNLSELNQLEIPHVSAYLFEAPENTPETSMGIERDNRHYFFTKEVLETIGYSHYEVSNYSRAAGTGSRKRSFQSKHNLKYWHNESYTGFGLSASGYEEGEDYKNTTDFSSYFKAIENHRLPRQESSRGNPELRRIIMGLRLLEGLPERYFENYREQLDLLLPEKILILKDGRIAVNPQKILLLNEILSEF
ncbi:MAG: radical SAM family heme chaperone HemW [bacterium]|nr:radical SAM family heme chaperone HemW [bacterium]